MYSSNRLYLFFLDEMLITDWLRKQVKTSPRARALLLPWWIRLNRLRWKMRNLGMRSQPVSYSAGDTQVYLYPVGQIVEGLWTWNFEAWERDFVARYLRRGICVVNVGANVGLYAVMAAALVGKEGEVHAFEPSMETFQRLLANLKLNNFSMD